MDSTNTQSATDNIEKTLKRRQEDSETLLSGNGSVIPPNHNGNNGDGDGGGKKPKHNKWIPIWIFAVGIWLTFYIGNQKWPHSTNWIAAFIGINSVFISLTFLKYSNNPIEIGWIKQSERAYSFLRIFIIAIWLLVPSLFAILAMEDKETKLLDLFTLAKILPITASIFILTSPLIFYTRFLRRRCEQELVRLHSLMRELIVMLFWSAQSNDNEITNKSKIAPDILTQLTTNSTADLSMKMLNSRFGHKPKDDDADEISLSRLARILKIVKKYPPPPK